MFLLIGQQQLIKNTDQSIVTIRPKYYIGSNGSVWASDIMKIRGEVPDLFEVNNPQSMYSIHFKSLCAKVTDIIFHFKDSTTEDDILSVSGTTAACAFARYENNRLQKLKCNIESAMQQWILNKDDSIENEKVLVDNLNNRLTTLFVIVDNAVSVITQFDEFSEEAFTDVYERLTTHCGILLYLFKSFNLSEVKPVIAEYTDAGPGVGVSNLEVRFRMAEMSRIHATSRRTRIHRARGDSAQNEAERTNSAIGNC